MAYARRTRDHGEASVMARAIYGTVLAALAAGCATEAGSDPFVFVFAARPAERWT